MENHHHHLHNHHQSLRVKMDKYPRDLLQGFAMSSGGGDDNTKKQQEELQERGEEEHEDEEVELNLGLSLGGRFGVDKNAKRKKLMRSSSVVGTMPLFREDDTVAPPPATYPALMRTSSLPTETEEEWRRRKEVQTQRRMEAKRRRSEKQRVSREVAGAGGASCGGGSEEVEGAMGLNRFGSSTVTPPPSAWGVAATKQVVLGDVLGKGKVGFQGLFTQPSSQGSVDSQGGSSSTVSEMESKPFLGSSSCGEARSPASNQSIPEGSSQDAVGSSKPKPMSISSRSEGDNPSKKPHPAQNIMGREIATNSMEDMPCVFTKGDGPNGRRIEGILYKYGKGEEVRIMCVCHGNFLSPAEFVKHAGGGDVANPLKHIVVNPSATPFL